MSERAELTVSEKLALAKDEAAAKKRLLDAFPGSVELPMEPHTDGDNAILAEADRP
jgi:hypothetical protein